jgi:hypothetical protein
MISIDRKFLFVHIPKTGGNSIQNVIRQYSDDQVVCLAPHQDGVEQFEVRSARFNTKKHSSLTDYFREYGAELFASLFKFTCVRNPWDRVVSSYFSPHRGKVKWTRVDFIQHIADTRPVSRYIFLDNGSKSTISAFTKNIDYFLRFESLQFDFNNLCEKVGIFAQELPRRNRSSRQPYPGYYDAESRDLVATKFQDEIEFFGYDF